MKITKTAIVGVLGLALAACGSSTKNHSPAPDRSSGSIQVLKTGVGQDTYDHDHVYAVALVRNPTDQAASLTVKLAAYDPAGKLLGTQDGASVIARAGATVATGAPLDIKPDVKLGKVTAVVTVGDSSKDAHPDSRFEASQIRLKKGDFELGHDILAQVTSHYAQNVTQVYVAAVCFDTSGNLVGGGEDYLDRIDSAQTVPVQFDVDVTGDPTRCELYPTLSAISDTAK
jgi:hypothetical protein